MRISRCKVVILFFALMLSITTITPFHALAKDNEIVKGGNFSNRESDFKEIASTELLIEVDSDSAETLAVRQIEEELSEKELDKLFEEFIDEMERKESKNKNKNKKVLKDLEESLEKLDSNPQLTSASYVRVKTSMEAIEEEGIMRHKVEIRRIIGSTPTSVKVNSKIKVGNKRTGSYKTFSEIDHTFSGKDVAKGKTKTEYYSNVYRTAFWYTTTASQAVYPNNIVHDYDSGRAILLNSYFYEYPEYEDDHSGIELIEPRADLNWVKPGDREPRPYNLRSKYIKWYENEFGEPDFDWSDYEIHHMIPLEYGGDNDYDNLIPLEKDFHKEVTRWWRYY